MMVFGLINKNSGPGFHRIHVPLLLMPDVDVYITNAVTEEDFEKRKPDVVFYNRLVSDQVLALMEKEPAMIIGLQERGELKWFVVRIIITMVTGSKSTPFVKLYRKHFEEFNIDHPAMNQPDFPINGRVVRELREQAVQYYIKHELYWYDRAIMELYMKHGSYRKIEEETRIPWESCYSTVRKCITRIRKEVLNVSE